MRRYTPKPTSAEIKRAVKRVNQALKSRDPRLVRKALQENRKALNTWIAPNRDDKIKALKRTSRERRKR